MKLFVRFLVMAPIGLFATAAGHAVLAAHASPAPTTDAAPTGAAIPRAEETAGERHGMVQLIGAALGDVCMSDEQRQAIGRLGAEVDKAEKTVSMARRALLRALGEQIEAGVVDACDVEDEIDALVAARHEATPVFRKALQDLHGILDKEQRAAFVKALETRIGELEEKDASGEWLDKLAKDLGLSAEQKTRVAAAFAEAKPAFDAERKAMKAALEAFEADDFSTDKLPPMSEVEQRTRERAEGMVRMAEALVEILTPAQRAALAKQLEEKAASKIAEEEMEAPKEKTVGAAEGALVVGRAGGFRTGYVGGWGGGYAASRSVAYRSGYARGYALTGGFGPGIW
jgi:Spy/CpxP family protein refolding chaperone